MLYASTRSKAETYTAQRTLWQDRAQDGGYFVPMKLPVFKRTEIIKLKNRTPEDNLALILNKFFRTEFSGKDVQFAIGRDYYKMVTIRQKTIMAELWHNPDGELDRIVRILTRKISVEQRDGEPGEWPKMAIRIGLLFAIFGELSDRGEVSTIYPIDLAVPAGDFSWPMAAWYARKMGLPIGTIICASCDSDGIRDLLHRGQIRLDGSKGTSFVPRYDCRVPAGLERLIYTLLGREEVQEFVRKLESGGIYAVNPEQKRLLSEGMYVSVNNSLRLAGVIPNAYRTFGYLMSPCAALVYTGVLDHQFITGKYSKVMMLCDYAPSRSAEAVSRSMGITTSELKKRLNLE